MRVALAVALAVIPAVALAGDPCPTRLFNGRDAKPWAINTTVYYDFDANVPDYLALQSKWAFDDWTDANESHRTNIKFERASAGHPANLTVSVGPLGLDPQGRHKIGEFTPQRFDFETRHLIEANIVVDLAEFDMTRPSFFDALRKNMAHEIGHSMGLNHPEDQQDGASVMNNQSGVNDEDGQSTYTPQDCDGHRAAVFNNVIYGPGAGGRFRREPPPNMPGPPHCSWCQVVILDPEYGTPIYTYAECCGANQGNGPYRQSPSLAFLALGYTCSMDGWINVRCNADLCCVHPDDFPRGAYNIPTGSTCRAMGWFDSDQRAACDQALGGSCVKKEVCGAGECMPWPNYCWKAPNGTEPHDPPPYDPHAGVTCGSKGWFNGDQLAACEAAHGSCIRKQDCDGQQCLPYPHYCWKAQ